MTRETKVGLLVGLAFIIVIGILLSDHFRSTMEPPQASLFDAGQSVRDGVTSPGTSNPPISIYVPHDSAPSNAVPTNADLTPHASPVVPLPTPAMNPADASQNPAQNMTADPFRPSIETPGSDQVAGADAPINPALNNAARQYGQQLELANNDGTPMSTETYEAQAGDTVSRMAARFLGSNTKANRSLIINANRSLQEDPNWIVVGKEYLIPVKASAVVPPNVAAQAIPGTAPVMNSTPVSGTVYTVQEGDSLWQIANDELGDASAVDAIKELNRSILRGSNHDVVVPGMKLRLPARPVASAS